MSTDFDQLAEELRPLNGPAGRSRRVADLSEFGEKIIALYPRAREVEAREDRGSERWVEDRARLQAEIDELHRASTARMQQLADAELVMQDNTSRPDRGITVPRKYLALEARKVADTPAGEPVLTFYGSGWFTTPPSRQEAIAAMQRKAARDLRTKDIEIRIFDDPPYKIDSGTYAAIPWTVYEPERPTGWLQRLRDWWS